MITFPSKKTLDEQKQDFTLLPADDYLLKIVNVEEKKQRKYQSEEMEDIVNVKLEILSFKDGEQAKDIEGENANGRFVFFTGRPDSFGFQSDGTPARTRCLVAYATGQDIFGDIDLESWEQLLGKEMSAEIIQKQNTKGETKNRISRFLAPKNRPKAKPAEKPAEKPTEKSDDGRIPDDEVPVMEEDEIDPEEIFK